MMSTEREDLWKSADKVYHVLLCFSLTLLFFIAISRTPFPLLRRRSLFAAGTLSLLAGGAKEVADHFNLFGSSGASAKDAVADVFGVLIACLFVSTIKLISPKLKVDNRMPGVSLV